MNALASLIRAIAEAAAKLLKNPQKDEAGVGDRCIIEVRGPDGQLKERKETK